MGTNSGWIIIVEPQAEHCCIYFYWVRILGSVGGVGRGFANPVFPGGLLNETDRVRLLVICGPKLQILVPGHMGAKIETQKIPKA